MEKIVSRVADSLYEQFIADFEMRSVLSEGEPTELRNLRQSAFECFQKQGFPSAKNEDWKYTHVAPYLNREFITAIDEGGSIEQNTLNQAQIKSLDCYQIVLLDGHFRNEYSSTMPREEILVSPISNSLQNSVFKEHFGRYADHNKYHFVALNTSMFQDGLFIEIPERAQVSKPIHIIHCFSSRQIAFIQPRNLIVVRNHARVSIVETFMTLDGDADLFVNDVTEIKIGISSAVNRYCIQNDISNSKYIHHTEVNLDHRSIYNNYHFSFPGVIFLRNNLNVSLDGENIECHLYGLYLAGGKQVIDNHTIVDHLKPNCQSNEFYKGVMKDEATGIFNGKIFVRKDAQKTNAFQKNNNLMLSKRAIVDSKPQLEIFADDVKCSHGSTVGQFNEDALFYLRSRGIGEERAKALLIHAFAYDVIEKTPLDPLKVYINKLIEVGLHA